MCAVFVVFILLFRAAGSQSLIDTIYTLVGYTYGPLLGLFAYALLVSRTPNYSRTSHLAPRTSTTDRWSPYVCVASPILCYAIQSASATWFDYHFGYELLMLNGLITFLGLLVFSRKK
jgi:hypothetical protein